MEADAPVAELAIITVDLMGSVARFSGGVFEDSRGLSAPLNAVQVPWHQPSSRRHTITALGFLACFTMEIARSFSVVVIPMSQHFGWDEAMVGKVLAASFYGYAPMQIPSGMLAHRFGSPRGQVR